MAIESARSSLARFCSEFGYLTYINIARADFIDHKFTDYSVGSHLSVFVHQKKFPLGLFRSLLPIHILGRDLICHISCILHFLFKREFREILFGYF